MGKEGRRTAAASNAARKASKSENIGAGRAPAHAAATNAATAKWSALVVALVALALWSALPNTRPSGRAGSPAASSRESASDEVPDADADSAGPPATQHNLKANVDKTLKTVKVSTRDVPESEPSRPISRMEKEWIPTTLSALVMSAGVKVGDRIIEPKPLKTKLVKSASKSKTQVKMYTLDDLLTSAECSGLIRAHDHHVQNMKDPIFCFDSETTMQAHLREHDQLRSLRLGDADFTDGTTCLNTTMSQRLDKFVKYSVSTAFYTGESKFSHEMDRRIEEASGMPRAHGGKYQVTSYGRGVGYKTHTDCRVGSREKRDRFATVLVYLNDVESGGHTIFPELGVSVEPRRARSLIWNSMSADGVCDGTSVHNASTVTSGRKVILQRWYYYHTFPTLGKRFDPPRIPARREEQPFISCDQYDQGSCRMYDEWQYIHIKEYVKQQMSG